MEYEDRIRIATPEGVDLELTLAGLGSRFVAEVLDVLLQLVLVGAVALAIGWLGGYGEAVVAVAVFGVLFCYHPFFELLASGRTPGKRATGLRVVMQGGHPVGLRASAVRNVLRLLDFLPLAYVVGSVAILLSSQNQRLGDLAADTLVVRERHGATPRPQASWQAAAPPALARAWDVSAVSPSELAAVRSFLARREELSREARVHLAERLAATLAPKVAGADPELSGEPFLEALAAAKAARG